MLKKWTWSKDQQIADELGELPEDTSSDLLGSEGDAGVEETAVHAEQWRIGAEADLNILAMLSMPTVFKVHFPLVLLAAWSLLKQRAADIQTKFHQIALGIPRGHAKTTLIKLWILYCILFTKRKFMLVICSTESNATNIISDVADMLDELNIIKLFGDWRLGMETDQQGLKKFNYRGRNIILTGIGTGGALRGMNIKNARPDFIAFDDIQTREDADSKVTSDGIEKWMIGTAMKAKSPHGCMFIFAGNMYPTPHSILRKLRDNSSWTKFISGAILADGTALWPELRSIDDLIQELDNDISSGHPEIFFSEVLNDIEAGTNTKTDLTLIKPWKWHPELDKPQGKFIIIDPASNKVGGDAVAIGYCEVYDGYSGLREVLEKNISPGETIRQALLMAMRHGVKTIAVESTSYQYSLLYWFNQVCMQIGLVGLHFVEIYTGNYSKNARITDMLKSLTAGEIFIHPSVRSQVVDQIVHFSPLRRNNNDGILDLLSYMPRVLELYGPLLMTEDDPAFIEASQSKVLDGVSCI